MKETKLKSTQQVAYEIGVSAYTLKRWYRWWESNITKPSGISLPTYETDSVKSRHFTDDSIKQLIIFKNAITKKPFKGCMAEFNAMYVGGKKGTEMLEKLGKTKADIKAEMIN